MSEEMRKEFESFMFDFLGVDVGGNRGITPSGHDGYVFEDDDSTMVCTVAWFSWNASREAMKPIKLPTATFETPGGDNALREDAVIDAIYAAGYKVAP